MGGGEEKEAKKIPGCSRPQEEGRKSRTTRGREENSELSMSIVDTEKKDIVTGKSK